jgi:putative methionine-R-sulfoxide reductase with GAF domain
VISNDVANGPRYLTAFGNTQSEIIVPIADEETQQIVRTLDIESDVKNAFSEEDPQQLEKYACVIAPLWK